MKQFLGCIAEAADAGDIDPATAERSRRTYERAYTAAEQAFGPAEADRMAADAVMGDLERQAFEARRSAHRRSVPTWRVVQQAQDEHADGQS